MKTSRICLLFLNNVEYFLLPLLRKKSSIFLARIVKAENGCGGTSTFFPFHLTSFILRAFCAQLTLYRTKRVVEVDQAESRKPFSLRSNTVLPSATTMLYFLCFYAHAAAAGTKSTNSRLSRSKAKITLISLIATAQSISLRLGC